MILLLTCEHGGNYIPPEYHVVFKNADQALASHRGYDLGAQDLFDYLKPLADVSYFHEISRLLVELNRSLHHPQLFSEYSRALSSVQKQEILDKIFHPYRKAVEEKIKSLNDDGMDVLHLAVHTFTPELHGEVRATDIGLLYDPSGFEEKRICKELKDQIKILNPNLRIRFNYPYLGISDGFPTHLRKLFPKGYSGIELEVNQKYANVDNKFPDSIKKHIYQSLRSLKEIISSDT